MGDLGLDNTLYDLQGQAGRGACFNKACTLEFYLCKEAGEVVRGVQGEGHPDPKVLEMLCGLQVWYSLCHPTMRATSGSSSPKNALPSLAVSMARSVALEMRPFAASACNAPETRHLRTLRDSSPH